jgi:hypothetical protein
MGFRWKLGNGDNIRFWEGTWIDNSSLAIQFWEVYCIVNEHNKSIPELWDEVYLKCSFKRCVDRRVYQMWEEVVSIASTIEFSADDDALVWQLQSSGLYSSHSLYRVINFRGIISVYTPSVWKLIIPPRVQIFLWLSKNKILTRDNLEKRRHVEDNSCLFCNAKESVNHLLFDYVVARSAWEIVSKATGVNVGCDYESQNSGCAIRNMALLV